MHIVNIPEESTTVLALALFCALSPGYCDCQGSNLANPEGSGQF